MSEINFIGYEETEDGVIKFENVNREEVDSLLDKFTNRRVRVWHSGFPHYLEVSRKHFRYALTRGHERSNYHIMVTDYSFYVSCAQRWE